MLEELIKKIPARKLSFIGQIVFWISMFGFFLWGYLNKGYSIPKYQPILITLLIIESFIIISWGFFVMYFKRRQDTWLRENGIKIFTKYKDVKYGLLRESGYSEITHRWKIFVEGNVNGVDYVFHGYSNNSMLSSIWDLGTVQNLVEKFLVDNPEGIPVYVCKDNPSVYFMDTSAIKIDISTNRKFSMYILMLLGFLSAFVLVAWKMKGN